MEQDQGWRSFLNLLLEVRSACGVIDKQVNSLHWKRTSHLFRLSECNHCYATLLRRGQEVIHEKDCVRISYYETTRLIVLTFWDQAHKRPLNYFGKFSLQLQKFFKVQFISILSVVIHLERPTKTSFSRNSFHFWSFVTQFYCSSVPPYFFFSSFFSSFLKENSLFLNCMMSFSFQSFSIWLKLHSLLQRLDPVISLLMSSEPFPVPPYSLTLLQNRLSLCHCTSFIVSPL